MAEHDTPHRLSLPMAQARERLAEMVGRVQDPRCHCVLTRHGRPVAALVSMDGLARIHRQEDRARVHDGSWAPGNFWTDEGTGRVLTREEAGEAVQKVQLDRLAERRILAASGLRPVPGGEVEMEATPEAVAPPRRRCWWAVWRG
ncbi:MAG: type II toxin-antitoxin system prevent-host-death family antitoxin [Pseudomonadota bacterium]